MYRNNFNTNKDGADIELVCSYDTCVARIDFEESIQVVRNGSYSRTSVGYYLDYGNVKDSDDIQWTIKGTVKDLKAYCKEQGGHYYEDSEINKLNKSDLIDAVLETLECDDTINVVTWDDFNEYQLKDSGLELMPANKTIDYVVTHGYSQGDYAKVFYSPSDLCEAWGRDSVGDSDVQKTINRIYWDCQIYGRFDIDGTEYYYHDYVDDTYEWNPDKFIEGVSKDSGVDVEELKAFIPEYPDYN